MQCTDFVDLLVASSEGLRKAHQSISEDWFPDEPPITTLFATLGDNIAEDFHILSEDAKSRIFLLIEEAMVSTNSELVTAVATGLIEAMVTRAVHIDGLWVLISQSLGSISLHHAKAWLAE